MVRLRAALTPHEWRRAAGIAVVIVGLHLVGLLLLLAGPVAAGLGITAYTLGLRHAFDADHIAAIDNTTRKLTGDGQRPLGVGFFFSLGHSTVVFVVGLLVAAGVRGLRGGGSALHFVGPAVSGTFLLTIGLLNLLALIGIVRVCRRMRRGAFDEAQLERELDRRGGVMTRLLGRATRAVRVSWHMYPLGLLFGLGFDTASEVALLVLAAAGAAGGLPLYAVLCLPILFAAGMCLFDTLDGAFMTFAYGWAFARPLRKVFYNLTVTGLSVAVALGVGLLQLLSLADVGGRIDLRLLGYAIVALFVGTWAVAVAAWRLGRVEERWSS